LTDGELEQVVKKSPIVKEGSSMTLNRSDSGYTFVNFNFKGVYLSYQLKAIFYILPKKDE
jgi:hypothetical protein